MSEQGKSLLVIQWATPLHQEAQAKIYEAVKPTAEALGVQLLIADSECSVQMHHDNAPLVAAIKAQTEAIGQLAASNFALVEAMAQDGEMGDDLPPTVGLNGKPL